LDFLPVAGDIKGVFEADSWTGVAINVAAAFAGPVFDGFKALAKVGKVARKYDVGPADFLRKSSQVGDQLDVHHIPQSNPAMQAVNGYTPKHAPAITIPDIEHRMVPTERGPSNLSARDQLAKDIRDLRTYTLAPNSSLRELIDLNKTMYPEMRK